MPQEASARSPLTETQLNRASEQFGRLSGAAAAVLLTTRTRNLAYEPTSAGKRHKLQRDVDSAETWLQEHASDGQRVLVERALGQARRALESGSSAFNALARTPGTAVGGSPGSLRRLWAPEDAPWYNQPAGRWLLGIGGLFLLGSGLAWGLSLWQARADLPWEVRRRPPRTVATGEAAKEPEEEEPDTLSELKRRMREGR